MATSKRSAGIPPLFEIDTNVEQEIFKFPSAPALPVRCAPSSDELLSSWLIRLAWMNAEKLHSFKKRFWHYPGSPWGRNIDLSLSEESLQKIAEITLITKESLADHTLSSYLGRIFKNVAPFGGPQGILAGRRRGQKVFGFGLQMCLDCMRSGSLPYFRRWWKLSYFVICPLHKRFLIDACPHCAQPLSYHLADFGKTLLPERIPTSFCANCGEDWLMSSDKPDEYLSDDFVGWQEQIFKTLETGWYSNPQIGPLYALSFFDGLRVLIRMVTAQGHCARLRHVIASETGILPLGVAHASNQTIFDGLRLGDRSYILHYVFWLLQEWPKRFIYACKRADLAFSYINNYRDSAPLPYWILSVVDQLRDPRHCKISDSERESVKQYLIKHGFSASNNQINQWMGRWYVSRHKHT